MISICQSLNQSSFKYSDLVSKTDADCPFEKFRDFIIAKNDVNIPFPVPK